MGDTAQIPVCRIPNCVNSTATVGAQGAVRIPHPQRSDCRTSTPPGVTVRPLRDDPIKTNEGGGKQSVIHHAFCSMPLRALDAVSQLQALGDAKYGAHNWRKISENEHLDHAFAHLMGDRLGDQTEDHLLHATWRLLAALEQRLFNKSLDSIGDDDD